MSYGTGTVYPVPPDIKKVVPLRHLWNAVHEDRSNQIVLVNGLPRKGKSVLACSFAWHLYRGTTGDFEHKFDVEKHVAFSKLDIQQAIKKYKTVGACLIWEEAGIAELGAGARDFWSSGNKALSTLFQTMGFRRQIVFVTLPTKIMIDKHLRLLSHVEIEAFKVNRRKKRCLARIKWNEMGNKGDIYGKYPRYVEDGLRKRIKTLSIPLPPDEVLKEYEYRSELFKEWLQNKLISDEVNKDKVKGKKSVTELLKEKYMAMIPKYKEYWNEEKKKFDVNPIIMMEEVSRHNGYILKARLDKEFLNEDGVI